MPANKKGNSMTVKPEGPAQEPPCAECGVPRELHDDPKQYIAPATPAPDGTCTECGQPNPIWFAPNDIWNKLIPGRVGFLCPRCFALKSPETVWVLQEAEPHVYNTSDAPSQPAGAREWLVAQHRADPAHINWRLMLQHEDVVVELMEAYARQQTAAKDALIDDLRRQRDLEWDSRKAAQSGRVAAERERDSLREALDQLLHTAPLGEARLTVRKLQDIADAALKAGKDGR